MTGALTVSTKLLKAMLIAADALIITFTSQKILIPYRFYSQMPENASVSIPPLLQKRSIGA
jgi:hypothetical protein